MAAAITGDYFVFYAEDDEMMMPHFSPRLHAAHYGASSDGDGRIARMVRGESRFGAELDSLSDAISFGVSPALILYLWSLKDLPRVGWLSSANLPGAMVGSPMAWAAALPPRSRTPSRRWRGEPNQSPLWSGRRPLPCYRAVRPRVNSNARTS